VALAFSAPVDCVPLSALAPDHAPVPVQAVALLEVHVKVELAPLATELGEALRLIVGSCFALTVTVADCAAVPPLPVQVREYVALAVSAPVDCVPLSALVPDHAPEAVHAVALLADQVSVEVAPLMIELGLAVKATVGAGALTETLAD
jgi:hypothetical protein